MTGIAEAQPELRADPERNVLAKEQANAIWKVVGKLPAQQRAIFTLRFAEEMSIEEVAESLSIPEATVRTRFFRARGLLREALSSEVDRAIDQAFAFAGERCNRITERVLARLAAVPE